MNHRQLGRSGLQVPVLSLGTGTGTGTFGGSNAFFERWGSTQGDEASRLVDVCLEHALTLFDTADIYSDGQSERVLGEVLRSKRDRALISTKATFPARTITARRGITSCGRARRA